MKKQKKVKNYEMSEDEELLTFCLENIKQCSDDMATFDSDRQDALRYYRSEHDIVPFDKGRSQATTTDLMDTIEWMMPTLLQIFTSDNEIASLRPYRMDDTEGVKDMDDLVNYQLRTRNEWWLELHDWFKEALTLKISPVKYQHIKERVEIPKEYEALDEIEMQALLTKENVEIVDTKQNVIQEGYTDPVTGAEVPPVVQYDVKVRIISEDETNIFEAIPSENIGFPLDTKNMKTCRFFYEKIYLDKWQFEKAYGKSAIVDCEATTQHLDANSFGGHPVTVERFKDLGGIQNFMWDQEKKQFIVYECFFPNPKNGDPWIVCLCGNNMLKNEYNKYGKPNYEVLTPVKMAHRMAGLSLFDILKDIMQIRTALLRQMLDNVYYGNNARYFGDPTRMNLNDWLNNKAPGSLVRVTGDPSTILMPIPTAPLPQWTFSLMEMMQSEKDYHSGVPRSFQGVNSNQLSDTWRGQASQINQAAMRVQMIASLFAWTGVVPLIKDFMDCNIKFLSKKAAIRVLDSYREIDPDNLVNRADVIVNIGIGNATKEQTIMYMQQLLAIYGNAFKIGSPSVNHQNFFFVMKELVKAMGYRNTQDFVTDPNLTQKVQQFMALTMQHLQTMVQQNPQMQQDPMIQQISQAGQQVMQIIGSPQQAAKSEMGDGEQPPQAAQPRQAPMPMGGGYFG